MSDRDKLYPECAGASLKWRAKCPRCGAGRQDNCGDNAAYEAQLRRRGVTPPSCISCAAKDAEIARLRAALAVFAQDENWRRNGLCDPNGCRFVGDSIARSALTGGAP